MLNAVAAAAAAVNKNSPQLFSKYIESVHKAMHQQEDSNNGSVTNETSHSKFVEHCRQFFDEPKQQLQQQKPCKLAKLISIEKSLNSNNSEDNGYALNNQPLNQSAFFYNTYTRQQTPSSASTKGDFNSSLPNNQYNKILHDKIINEQTTNTLRSSSLGFDSSGNRRFLPGKNDQLQMPGSGVYPGSYFNGYVF